MIAYRRVYQQIIQNAGGMGSFHSGGNIPFSGRSPSWSCPRTLHIGTLCKHGKFVDLVKSDAQQVNSPSP